MAKGLVFFIDFDGTVVPEDVCATMVKAFASEGWAELNRLWEQGVITTGECAQATLNLISALPEELSTFYMQRGIDTGFPGFLQWARERNYPVYILSDGYSNYIDLILKRENIDLDYYANTMEYQKGWIIRMPHLNPECGKCGVCKKEKVETLAPAEYIKIYIGDGYSDLCPARYADIVFAKQTLAELCLREGIAFYGYQNFDDVLVLIKELFKTDKEQ